MHPENMCQANLQLTAEQDYAQTAVGQGGVEPLGRVYDFHAHYRAQLFQIVSGSLRLETVSGTFVVPPERAVFVPSMMAHKVTYLQPTTLSYLFFRPDAVSHLPMTVGVTQTTPLLRELTLAFLDIPRSQSGCARAERLAAVILDQLGTSAELPLYLPMPNSDRLRRMADAMRNDPGDDRGIADVAAQVAMSTRNFQRRFQSETGLTYRAWKRQARLVRAVELLAEGRPVGDVAHLLGYSSPSAFISAFHQAFGVPPSRYFKG